MSDVLLALRALDAVMSLGINARINLERYRAMKAANDGEPLTNEQLAELTRDAQSKLDRH